MAQASAEKLEQAPDPKVGGSQGEREREGSKREHGEERADSTLKGGRFKRDEGGQGKRASLGKIEGSINGRVDAKAL